MPEIAKVIEDMRKVRSALQRAKTDQADPRDVLSKVQGPAHAVFGDLATFRDVMPILGEIADTAKAYAVLVDGFLEQVAALQDQSRATGVQPSVPAPADPGGGLRSDQIEEPGDEVFPG